MLVAVAHGGLRFGLIMAAFWFGFRHGIDWDHIAAITDITSSQEERRRSMLFGTLYALGHALVVLMLGIIAILVGERLPESVDEVMTRIVGATLVALGIYVFASLVKHGRAFRMRSRWMLVFAGVRKGARWVRRKVSAANGEALTGDAEHIPASAWHHGHHGLPGHHHHASPEADDAFMNYGRATSFGVGMIHGVGAETPTQVLIFLTAAGAGGTLVGISVLGSFIAGLVASNSVITIGSAYGFMHASKNFAIYSAVAIVTGFFSLVIGTAFLFGRTTMLPALFGG